MSISKTSITQLMRFALVGFCNTVVDYGTFYLLIAVVGLHKSLAQVFATAVAMSVSFLLNRKWTFQKNGRGNAKELGKFIIVNILSMLLLIAVTHLFYDILHVELVVNEMLSTLGVGIVFSGNKAVLLAKLISSVFSVLVNFIGNKFWVFGARKEEKAE